MVLWVTGTSVQSNVRVHPKYLHRQGRVCPQSCSQQSRADEQLGEHTFSKCVQWYGDQNLIFLNTRPAEAA